MATSVFLAASGVALGVVRVRGIVNVSSFRRANVVLCAISLGNEIQISPYADQKMVFGCYTTYRNKSSAAAGIAGANATFAL